MIATLAIAVWAQVAAGDVAVEPQLSLELDLASFQSGSLGVGFFPSVGPSLGVRIVGDDASPLSWLVDAHVGAHVAWGASAIGGRTFTSGAPDGTASASVAAGVRYAPGRQSVAALLFEIGPDVVLVQHLGGDVYETAPELGLEPRALVVFNVTRDLHVDFTIAMPTGFVSPSGLDAHVEFVGGAGMSYAFRI